MPATPEQRAAFGQELRAARQQRGMTMQQVVDALRPQDPSLSTPRLSAWEKGQYAPSSSSKVTMLEGSGVGRRGSPMWSSFRPSDRVPHSVPHWGAVLARFGLPVVACFGASPASGNGGELC